MTNDCDIKLVVGIQHSDSLGSFLTLSSVDNRISLCHTGPNIQYLLKNNVPQ